MSKRQPTFKDYIAEQLRAAVDAAKPAPKPAFKPKLSKAKRRGLAALRAVIDNAPGALGRVTSDAEQIARAMGGASADVSAALDWIKEIQAWHGQPAPHVHDPRPPRAPARPARKSKRSSAQAGSPSPNGPQSCASTPSRSTDGSPARQSPKDSPATCSAPQAP